MNAAARKAFPPVPANASWRGSPLCGDAHADTIPADGTGLDGDGIGGFGKRPNNTIAMTASFETYFEKQKARHKPGFLLRAERILVDQLTANFSSLIAS
ncbi:MAG TPA: hypothetical protein VFB29_05105 [Pseudolabrys sp.]|nr:hypothetical protein [Pseudolabrys sp.]